MFWIFFFCVNCEVFENIFFSFRENFIKVDVFYQEISYEEIQQNKAFEFLSLLSEVSNNGTDESWN